MTRPDDRLCPSLFDRLCDDAPGAPRDPRAAHGWSADELRRAVVRDLQWLFDTTRRDGHRTASVIDYGLPPLAGRPVSSCDVDALARTLADTLLAFEPRLVPGTIHVVPDRPGHPATLPTPPRQPTQPTQPTHRAPRQVLRFRIEAQLRLHPVPIELLLCTEIDLESGRARVEDVA